MSEMAFEGAVLLLLFLANGIFAMAELAVVSSRKSRLRNLLDRGDARARVVLDLIESPNRFLATVQIGITVVSIGAGVFSGATLSDNLATALGTVPALAPYASVLAFTAVILVVTWISLIIGELVPKRMALANPEAVALRLSGLMRSLSRAASPAVTFLGWSTDVLVRLLRIKPAATPGVSEEEVRHLMHEGLRAGVFLPTESAMVESVLELDRLAVRDLMTPRAKIIWIHLHDPHELIWHKIVVSAHSSFPVYDGNRDNVVGVVSVKAIYANLAAGTPVRVQDVMTPPLVVPASQNAVQLLETFKKSTKYIALVADEFGSIVGLVTLHDVMEAVLGDIPSQSDRLKPAARRRDDGSWLVDAMIEASDFEQAVPGFKLDPPAARDYQTLGGFVTKHLGHVPREGESFRHQGYLVEVIDMDRHRVDKVLLIHEKPDTSAPAAPPGKAHPP